MLLFSLCVHALDPACLAKCHTLIIIMNRNVTKHDVDYSTNNKCWLGEEIIHYSKVVAQVPSLLNYK